MEYFHEAILIKKLWVIYVSFGSVSNSVLSSGQNLHLDYNRSIKYFYQNLLSTLAWKLVSGQIHSVRDCLIKNCPSFITQIMTQVKLNYYQKIIAENFFFFLRSRKSFFFTVFIKTLSQMKKDSNRMIK